MDPLEALGDHRAHAEQRSALRGPVARRARAVLLAGDHHQRGAGALVRHRGVEERQRCAVRRRARPPAFHPRREVVLEPDVGERAAHHHFVIAAARAVGVEILALHAERREPLPRRALLGDRAGRGDVVRGDRIAEHPQHARVAHRMDPGRGHRHAGEVRRMLHVGGSLVPCVAASRGDGDRLPRLVAAEHVGVLALELLALHGREHRVRHLLRRRPDVT